MGSVKVDDLNKAAGGPSVFGHGEGSEAMLGELVSWAGAHGLELTGCWLNGGETPPP